jgi:hypothetical protein
MNLRRSPMTKFFILVLLLTSLLISVELNATVYYRCPIMRVPIVPSEKGWSGVPAYESSSEFLLAEYSVTLPNHLLCSYSSHPTDPSYPVIDVSRDAPGETCIKIIHPAPPSPNSDPGDFSCTDPKAVIKTER